MERPRKVLVYMFTHPTGGDVPEVSRFKATREAIVKTYHGRVIELTREEVPMESLDTAGRYMRRPTGWGRQPV